MGLSSYKIAPQSAVAEGQCIAVASKQRVKRRMHRLGIMQINMKPFQPPSPSCQRARGFEQVKSQVETTYTITANQLA
jgi:hypothetical protein